MKKVNSAFTCAGARVDVVGGTADMIEGATLSMAVWDEATGSMMVWCRASRTFSPTTISINGREGDNPNEEAPLGRLLAILGLDDPVRLEIINTIPPRSGLGGSTSSLVAAAAALNELFGWGYTRYEIAELAQRADLLPKQAQGYQDPYAVAFGGLNLFGFDRKRIGQQIDDPRTGKRITWIYDEPFATVERLAIPFDRLGSTILIAVPKGLDRFSGEVNAQVIRRFLEHDPKTIAEIKRKGELALWAKTHLVAGAMGPFWGAVEEDLQIMNSWGWVTPRHREILEVASSEGMHAKVCGAAGAVAIFCADGAKLDQFQHNLKDTPLADVYSAHQAPGVCIELRWPFGD